VNQIKKIAQSLILEFGDSFRQESIIVDIDQSSRPTYANKREKATTGKSPKRADNKCLQWSVSFSVGEVIDQQLKEGYRHCIDDFKERYQKTKTLLGRIDLSKHRRWIFKF
jgi:ribosomal protein L31